MATKRKDYYFEMEIPEGIVASLKDNTLTLKKDSKELKRKINDVVAVKIDGNKITLTIKKAKKFVKREFGTARSHIKNMIKGLTEGFEYELEVCNVHFPMTVTYDKAKSEFIIKNLLGEKAPRILKTAGFIEVEIKAPKIKLKSYDLEAAGQIAANLEKASRIRNRDRNKFQDGIFITKKPGVDYL